VLLYNVAVTSEACEDTDGAAWALREGLPVASDAGDETSVAYYLQRLATVEELRDDPGRAVSLLAAADVLTQAAGTGWLRAYAPAGSPDGSVSQLGARVGDAAFQEAWARGAAMGHQRAVAYALERSRAARDRRRGSQLPARQRVQSEASGIRFAYRRTRAGVRVGRVTAGPQRPPIAPVPHRPADLMQAGEGHTILDL
jgi:hypothetical protein